MIKACFAEMFGTMVIVFFGSFLYKQLDDINTANEIPGSKKTIPNWSQAAIGQGLMQMICIWSFYKMSGAHFNPAVTIACMCLRKMPTKAGVLFMVSQVFGSFVASLLFTSLKPSSSSLGIPKIQGTFTESSIFFVEFLATAFYMWAVYAFTYDHRNDKNLIGLVLGMMAIGQILCVGPISGAAINPARTLGPILVTLMGGNNWMLISTELYKYWYYLLGPVLGALCVSFYYEFFLNFEEELNPDLSFDSYDGEKEQEKEKLKY